MILALSLGTLQFRSRIRTTQSRVLLKENFDEGARSARTVLNPCDACSFCLFLFWLTKERGSGGAETPKLRCAPERAGVRKAKRQCCAACAAGKPDRFETDGSSMRKSCGFISANRKKTFLKC